MPTNRFRRSARRGQTAVEFSLSFLLFLSIILGFGQLAFAIWVKSTLHSAVIEGVRYGITGQTKSGLGHDDSIRQVVVQRAMGLIPSAQASSMVSIDYYDFSGNAAAAPENAGGNTLVLSVSNYPVPILAAVQLTSVPTPLQVNVTAVGRLEPYRTPPPR